jgi:predicted glutamine amidotransferase
MCVAITMEPGAELTVEEVVKMDRTNADGVGIAWAYEGAVHWYKTTKVDPKYIQKMIYYWSEFPRLVHFRLATAGGTRADLCHPFEIGPLANCAPRGSGAKVMIHNGHWSRWSEVHDLMDKEGLLPDRTPWSDTRLAAYLSYTDPDWLVALGGRVATMDGDGAIERIGSWDKLRDGIHCSNMGWASEHTYKRGGYAGYNRWKGWDWEESDWAAYEASERAKLQPPPEEPVSAVEEKAEESSGQNQKASGKEVAKSHKVDSKGRVYSDLPFQRGSRVFQYDPEAEVVVDVTAQYSNGATKTT